MTKLHGSILASKPLEDFLSKIGGFINHKQLKLLRLLSPVVVQEWIRIRPLKKLHKCKHKKIMQHSAIAVKVHKEKRKKNKRATRATTSRTVA